MRNVRRPEPPVRRSLRVLFADDDQLVIDAVRAALERIGHRVESFSDGLTAFERLAADVTGFDVILTDHWMPKQTGLGLVSKVRDTAFAGAIIVHSSPLSDAERGAYRQYAVDFFVNKPTTLAQLLAVFEQVEARFL